VWQSHADPDGDSDCNCYAISVCNADGDANSYANTDANADSHGNGYGHCDGNFDANPHTPAQEYADAQAAADASSAGGALIGPVKAGTRERKLRVPSLWEGDAPAVDRRVAAALSEASGMGPRRILVCTVRRAQDCPPWQRADSPAPDGKPKAQISGGGMRLRHMREMILKKFHKIGLRVCGASSKSIIGFVKSLLSTRKPRAAFGSLQRNEGSSVQLHKYKKKQKNIH
jgi:hypothetical protein